MQRRDQRPKAQIDLLSMLRGGPETLPALVAGLAEDDARRPVAAGEWSISEIVAHMVDAEHAWFRRVRLMLEEEGPALEPYPNQDWSKPALDGSLRDFQATRAIDVGLLEALSPEQWDRGGRHSSWGEIDVGWVASHLAAHDAEHLAQIARSLRTGTP